MATRNSTEEIFDLKEQINFLKMFLRFIDSFDDRSRFIFFMLIILHNFFIVTLSLSNL